MKDLPSGLRLFRWCIFKVFVTFLDDRTKVSVERTFKASGERCCDQDKRLQCLYSKIIFLRGQDLEFECVPQRDGVEVDGLGLVACNTSLKCVQDIALRRSVIGVAKVVG